MKTLIIGGNRFFGKKLAKLLIADGHEVTLLNRGSSDDGFGSSIQRILCDRNDIKKLTELTQNKSWDLIFDQICFDYTTAKNACETFKGKTKKYIFTSTKSVYPDKPNLKETDFDPYNYKFDKIEPQGGNYGEAKRQAEVAFFKYSSFPVTAVRFPIVIGNDDYTKRFHFHVDHIKNNKPIFFPSIEAKISFVSSDDAARALQFLSKSDFSGPINVASPEPISLNNMIKMIEEASKSKRNLSTQASETNHSPYGISSDWYASCVKLNELGLKLSEVTNWLPEIIATELEKNN